MTNEGEIRVKSGMSFKRVGDLRRALCADAPLSPGLLDWYVHEMTKAYGRGGVKVTPLLLLLAEDVITHCALVREAHEALNRAGEKEKSLGMLDTVLKLREKLRKSVGDFLDACAPSGGAALSEAEGLESVFAKVDCAMGGVLEAALAHHEQEIAGGAERSGNPGRPLNGTRPDMQAVSQDRNEVMAVVMPAAGEEGSGPEAQE